MIHLNPQKKSTEFHRMVSHTWDLKIYRRVSIKVQRQSKRIADPCKSDGEYLKCVRVIGEGCGFTGDVCGLELIFIRNINSIVNHRITIN